MDLQLQPFSAINLADEFFDSLKEAYPEFCEWYNRKAAQGEKAYVSCFEDGRVADFLYMKIETEAVEDVVPVLPAKRRLKVGTFKLLSRGTRRGERKKWLKARCCGGGLFNWSDVSDELRNSRQSLMNWEGTSKGTSKGTSHQAVTK